MNDIPMHVHLGEPEALYGNLCEVHAVHNFNPLRTVRHHIVPQEYGGKTEPGNMLLTCDTGHYNIHALLEMLRRDKGKLPRYLGTRKERYWAREAYRRMQEAQ